MSNKKRRSMNQIKEEKSYQVFRSLIPEEWVVHEYGPDYGIDCIVELFDYVDYEKEIAETLGEVFFVQLKSSSELQFTNKRVYFRKNILKYHLEEDKQEYKDIEVVKFNIDVPELLTIQSMGSVIPVILILLDINTNKIYYLCLNDYIDKVLLPSDSNYGNKKTKTIYIPVQNEIRSTAKYLIPLRTFAKRSKLHGAFSTFTYQNAELEFFNAGNDIPFEAKLTCDLDLPFLKVFMGQLLSLDIWENSEFWPILKSYHNDLLAVKDLLSNNEITYADFQMHIKRIWNGLAVLPRTYEEIVRETFLPTFLGCSLSDAVYA